MTTRLDLMLNATIYYSDLLGGVLGIFGSIVLGYPLITEMTDRLQWDLLRQYRDKEQGTLTGEEIDAYRSLRERLIDGRLGEHQRYRRLTINGFILLLLAFLFLTIASCDRAIHGGGGIHQM
jgi:hypothetical protein